MDGVERFEWSHSYSKVYHPKKKYDPHGTFMTFENYNVEVRERVKCISGMEGVPVSIQWEPRGFFYPTQIAQFGLAHYSKNITEGSPHKRIIYDGEKYVDNWIVGQDATMFKEYDESVHSNVMRFSTRMAGQVWMNMNMSQDFVFSLDVLLKLNSTITVVLQNNNKKEMVSLHYISSNVLITALVS